MKITYGHNKMLMSCDPPAQSVLTLSVDISLSLFPWELLSLLALISQVISSSGSYPQSSLLSGNFIHVWLLHFTWYLNKQKQIQYG